MTDVMAPRGLGTKEASRLLAAEGHNRVISAPPPRLVSRVARQFADPLVALLLVSAAVTAFLGDLTDTAVIVLVVTVNTVIGVTQEVRAEQAIAALQRLGAPTARVVRDGLDQVVPAADLVRGDLVLLGAGDVIPADLDVGEAQRLQIDESMLTGESMTVSREAGDEVAAGTVVVTGRASGTVVRTGAGQRAGPHRRAGRRYPAGTDAIATTARAAGPGARRRRGAHVGCRDDGRAAVRSKGLEQMAITAVSLVVAAVPESLPAVVTLALALGAFRMVRGHAVARRLHAVETLGSVSVVASDKTGTLTEGRMAVEYAVVPDGTPLAHLPAAARGTTRPASSSARTGEEDAKAAALLDLARAAALCNDAALRAAGPGRSTVDRRGRSARGGAGDLRRALRHRRRRPNARPHPASPRSRSTPPPGGC